MRKGDVLFFALKYGALSLLGSMTWEALGAKWPERQKSGTPPNTSTPPRVSGVGSTHKEKRK